jgi:hypothetical protein
VDKKGKPLHSWRVLILPYIEQEALYNQIRLDEPWDSEHNRQFHDQMPMKYKCPSNPGSPLGKCCYSAIAGGIFNPATKAGSVTGMKLEDITDGLSNTIAIIEVKEAFCWMDPTADVSLDKLVQTIRKGSYHTGGVNAVCAGIEAICLPADTSSEILQAGALPKDGK